MGRRAASFLVPVVLVGATLVTGSAARAAAPFVYPAAPTDDQVIAAQAGHLSARDLDNGDTASLDAVTGSDSASQPALSEDGYAAAYTYRQGADEGIAELDLTSAGPAHAHLTTEAGNGVVDADPSVAGEMQAVAFDRTSAGATSVWTITRSGEAQRLVSGASHPAWDPVGYSVSYAYTSPQGGCLVGNTELTDADRPPGQVVCVLTAAAAAAALPGSTAAGLRALDLTDQNSLAVTVASTDGGRTSYATLDVTSAGTATTIPATVGTAPWADVTVDGFDTSVTSVRPDGHVVETDLPDDRSVGVVTPALADGGAAIRLRDVGEDFQSFDVYEPQPAPVRVADTRSGLGGTHGPIAPDGTLHIEVPESQDSDAVVLDLIAISGSGGGYVTAYDDAFTDEQLVPSASTLNIAPHQTVATSATVGLFRGDGVTLRVSGGPLQLIVDEVGFYGNADARQSPAGVKSLFHVLPTPTRLLDTRQGSGGPIGAGQSRIVPVAGVAGVPADATAAVVTVAGSGTVPTYLSAVPSTGATGAPGTSNVNLPGDGWRSSLATVTLGSSGALRLFNAAGDAQATVDLVGYYVPEADGGDEYFPADFQPVRVLDTRSGSQTADGSPHRIVAGTPLLQRIAGLVVGPQGATWAGLPAGVDGVLLSAGVTGGRNVPFVTLGDGKPTGSFSSINTPAGQTTASEVLTAAPGGQFQVGVGSGSADVFADLEGYFGTAAAAPSGTR